MSSKTKVTAQQILSLWDEKEESMGTYAAFSVTIEQLGLTHDEAMQLLKAESEKQKSECVK